jgi:hypothetical protein
MTCPTVDLGVALAAVVKETDVTASMKGQVRLVRLFQKLAHSALPPPPVQPTTRPLC